MHIQYPARSKVVSFLSYLPSKKICLSRAIRWGIIQALNYLLTYSKISPNKKCYKIQMNCEITTGMKFENIIHTSRVECKVTNSL